MTAIAGTILGIFAGILQLAAYAIYGHAAIVGRIHPNAASWAIWGLAAVLETTTYVFVTRDWAKNILPVVCSVCAVALFLACLLRGRFQRPSRGELAIVGFDVAALAVWRAFHSAMYANALLVFTAVVSFMPLLTRAQREPQAEQPLPWCLWSAAYLCMTFTVLLRWEKPDDMLYPLVFFVLHMIVAYVVVQGRAKQARVGVS